jgi:sulfate transport system ATP-binding protein
VKFIASAGAVVRVELRREQSGETVEAEITRERYRELGLYVGIVVNVGKRALSPF